jgi:hypothetical protein
MFLSIIIGVSLIIGVLFIIGVLILAVNVRICKKCKTINFIETYGHRDWEVTTHHYFCKCKKCGKILCDEVRTKSD